MIRCRKQGKVAILSCRPELHSECNELKERFRFSLPLRLHSLRSFRRAANAHFIQSEAEYNRIMGFEEIAHTADWSVRVWAPDLPSLFGEAARAMNSLAGTVIDTNPRVKRTF